MTPKELADSLRAELDGHIATIRHIADQIEAMDDSAQILTVPYRSQWDVDAQAFKSDCGPTSLAMLLDWRGKRISIDALARECLMSAEKPYTNKDDLIRVARLHGLSLSRLQPLTLFDLETEIRAGRPCIALVRYSDFGDLRQDKNFVGTHWLVVVGFDAGSIIMHDPDWRGTGGANFHVPRATFDKAWGDTMDEGLPRQALMIRD